MLQLIMLLAATSALGCDIEYALKQVQLTVLSPLDAKRWSAPSEEGMQCLRGYSNCWTQVNTSEGCKKEFSVTDTQSCIRYRVSVYIPRDNQTTSGPVSMFPNTVTYLETEEPAMVREQDENFDQALWRNVLTPKTGCASRTSVFTCDDRTTNCPKSTDLIPKNPPSITEKNIRDCGGFFTHAVVLDVSYQKSDNFSTPSTTEKTGEVFNNTAVQEETTSFVTVAWSTSIPNNQCIVAYNVCRRKDHTAYVGCERPTTTYSTTTFGYPATDTIYELSLIAVPKDIHSDAARLECNCVIGILTLFILARLYV